MIPLTNVRSLPDESSFTGLAVRVSLVEQNVVNMTFNSALFLGFRDETVTRLRASPRLSDAGFGFWSADGETLRRIKAEFGHEIP